MVYFPLIVLRLIHFLSVCSDRVWKEALWNEALSKAAKTGKRDMMKYLLSSEDISVNLSTEVYMVLIYDLIYAVWFFTHYYISC